MLLNNIYANILVKVKLGISQFQLQSSPPGEPPGNLTFLKYFGQIPHYVCGWQTQSNAPLCGQKTVNIIYVIK